MKKLGIIICGLVLVMGCQRNVYRFTEGHVYGTVYHVSYQSETDYAVEIRQEMERVNQSLSMFNKNSVIARWNRGECEQVDSLFVIMYRKAKEVNEATRSEERRVGKECRSEEHTSELQSRYLISYAVFCLKK